MANKNTIVALAYLREADNPLKVFCTYITYCLSIAANNQLRNDELCASLKKEFGLMLPNQIIRTTIRRMHEEKKIQILPSGAGYRLVNFDFNIEKFVHETQELKSKEQALILDLIDFISTFRIIWQYDQARDYLTHFLIESEYAYQLFSTDKPIQIDERYVSPNTYIGKYVNKIINENNANTDYLVEIVKGIMIYCGIFISGDIVSQKHMKFSGVRFYLDTRLVLRALGYSWDIAVIATRELLDLLRNEYSSKLYVFSHTIQEINYALQEAETSLRLGNSIQNNELRVFTNNKNYKEEDFRIDRLSISTLLANIGIEEDKDKTDWNEGDVRKYNVDWDKLTKFISKRHPDWKKPAIINDVNSINRINYYRRADYSIRYGGANKLPVFVTTNIALVNDIKHFYFENNTPWSSNLPLISEELLMCRLWLPYAKEKQNVPKLTLARNALVAQQGDVLYYEKLKKAIKDVEVKHRIIPLDEYRMNQFEEMVLRNSEGKIDEITSIMVANSFDELVRMQLADKDRELQNRESIITQKDDIIISQENIIINNAVYRISNFIGKHTIFTVIANTWWIISAFLVAIIDITLCSIFAVSTINLTLTTALLPILIKSIIEVVKRISTNEQITDKLQVYFIKKAKVAYEKQLAKRILQSEKQYEDRIISECSRKRKLYINRSSSMKA